MSLKTKIFTWVYGKKVGEDEYGNQYYMAKPQDHWWQLNRCAPGKWGRDRRWVIYGKQFKKHGIEASAVPAEWNIWLHYTSDTPLDVKQKHKWQKPFIANPTGTKDAILPQGLTAGLQRQKSAQDFTPWKPKT